MRNLSYALGGGALVFGNAGIAEGTGAGTVQIATAFDFTNRGRFATKAITDNIALTAQPVQAINTTCFYLLSIDSAGAVTTTKGQEVLTAELANGAVGLHYPNAPEDDAVFGAIKVVTNGSTTFTSGTTDLGAAGITDTYENLSAAPADNT